MENTLTSFINRVDFVKNSEMGHPIYRVTFTPSKGKTMIGYTRSKSHLSQICPSFEGDTCDVAYDINDKGKVIVRDIKKCGGEMNESKLRKIITESIGKVVKMGGDEYTALKQLSSKLFDNFTDNEKIFFYDLLNHNTWDVVYAMMGVLKPTLPDGWIYESKIRETVNKSMNRVLKENKEQPDFYDFIDILERNGWSYSDFHDVQTKDGRTGTRFIVYKDDKSSSDFETLQQDLQKLFGDHVDFGIAQYRYAPEIKHHTVIILDYNDDDASAPLNESKLRSIIKESIDKYV